MSQVSCYRTKRPVTASPNNGRARVPLSPSSSTTGGGGLLASGEQIKRFRSEFPNLPGFSRHALLRPQSPKVSLFAELKMNGEFDALKYLTLSFNGQC